MNPYILQDIQQIRTICQQLAQTEQGHAQHFSQQPALQAWAQQENFVAQQLHQVVALASRAEQSLIQTQPQTVSAQFSQPVQFSQAATVSQPYMSAPWSQPQVNPAAINAVMRAAQPASGMH